MRHGAAPPPSCKLLCARKRIQISKVNMQTLQLMFLSVFFNISYKNNNITAPLELGNNLQIADGWLVRVQWLEAM